MRFLTPFLFFTVAAWVDHTNSQGGGRFYVFPMLDKLMPSLANDPVGQGRVTVWILCGFGFFTLARALWATLRRRDAESD